MVNTLSCLWAASVCLVTGIIGLAIRSLGRSVRILTFRAAVPGIYSGLVCAICDISFVVTFSLQVRFRDITLAGRQALSEDGRNKTER